jgi:hypothetical protein
MSVVESVVEGALHLSEEERVEIARRLLLSVKHDADAAWSSEINRRIEEIDNGQVELVDAFAAIEEARKALNGK